MAEPSNFLSVSGLEKVYGVLGANRIGLQPTSFQLPKSAFFTLLGPSGCGKTTTLRCIAGLERPDKGTIRVGDKLVFDSDAGIDVSMDRRQFGMVFQSYAIWPHMNVFENVAFPLRVSKDRRFSANEIRKAVGEALDTVGLGGLAERHATRLSGGQQQRVALARAIVRRPDLLLLDEPLSNLDAALREEMRNELRRLQQQMGLTTVYVTHDQSEALELSDSIAVMNAGRIVQIDTPRTIYFNPVDEFAAGFVGTTNWIRGEVERVSGDRIVVKTDAGSRVECAATASYSPGDKVSLAVRPEVVEIAPENAAPAPGLNEIAGRIVFCGFNGSLTRYQVQASDATFQVYGSPKAGFKLGDAVALRFDPASVVLFTRPAG
ncbi:ABC transporter ATP-binding protein [Mesorhizobium sp. YC-39]|uniref:ABC transporter ATP-binding protein n=1 Tax=unclassified Mesorhizobium TaxID=325217 RepID=UPI0021E8FFF0|nr:MULTISPECIES: ABC transporter ATP-binding protein [unclassified Mesorhizobium]MCV3205619.1 ABC transporter ATP-binding protein [Mesorhizobium sp. YC-2]MCV3227982.1 ABC transporter ATP-binding protein [Mesorhizobium sp. YC-39]